MLHLGLAGAFLVLALVHCGADLGTGIHRYRRLTRLGRGGMGEVWLAVRTGRAGFHRLVVLKRMLDEDTDDPAVQLQRFIGEWLAHV
ncbi:MAG TPA: hypothetical protein VE057_15885 [Archangium sp.]|nr:hypothetical protein [Archangium sp.]